MLWSSDRKKKRQIKTSVPQLYPSLAAHPPISSFQEVSHCPSATTLTASGDGGRKPSRTSGILTLVLLP